MSTLTIEQLRRLDGSALEQPSPETWASMARFYDPAVGVAVSAIGEGNSPLTNRRLFSYLDGLDLHEEAYRRLAFTEVCRGGTTTNVGILAACGCASFDKYGLLSVLEKVPAEAFSGEDERLARQHLVDDILAKRNGAGNWVVGGQERRPLRK